MNHHSLYREGDPSFAQFLAAMRRGLSAEEAERFNNSPYCIRLRKLAWRNVPPTPNEWQRYQSGTMHAFEVKAMEEFLQEPEGAEFLASIDERRRPLV